jgi:hypothetical protein
MSVTAADVQAQEPFERAAGTDHGSYRAQAGTDFRVTRGDAIVVLRLASVSDDQRLGEFQQFSLYFHGPPAALLTQGIYLLDHDVLGTLALFIVPILGSNQERIVYEACFNRRVPGDAVAKGVGE